MNQVSIAKALKIKSRLTGELALVTREIQQRNSYCKERTNTIVDTKPLIVRYDRLMDQLIEVKSKISIANLGIYPRMERMNQLKAKLTAFKELSCRDDKEPGIVTRTGETKESIWLCSISEEERNTMVATIQRDIENIQDSLDEYNASTRIELSF